jgi:hypothetical protein
VKQLKSILTLVTDCQSRRNYFGDLGWQRHFYEGLRQAAERLIIPDELDFAWSRATGEHVGAETPYEAERNRTSEQLWERIQAAQRQRGLDAVITFCFGYDLNPDVVKSTIKLGVPWINFFCDSIHMFDKVAPLARLVSLNWFPESEAIPRYQALGVPHLCAPYAWNPEWLPDLTNETVVRTAAFIGLPTSNRITRLGLLRLYGCPVEIRGKIWTNTDKTPFYSPVPAYKRMGRALFKANLSEKIVRRLLWPLVRPMAKGQLNDEDTFQFLKETLVVLGLNQSPDAQGRLTSYLKYRDMEYAGHGSCYLTEHNADIPRVFEVGKEVLTFNTMSEAASHIKRLQRQPELARQIGRAGRRRVLEEHNWKVRLEQLARAL